MKTKITIPRVLLALRRLRYIGRKHQNCHISWCDSNRPYRLILFLVLFCLISGTSRADKLVSRVATHKPASTIVTAADYSDRIVLKFQEDSDIRLRAGRFIGRPGVELLPLEELLRSYAILPRAITRVFDRPEQDLDTEREVAQRQSGRELANLNLYYHVTLPPGSDGGVFCDALNALPFVELATPAPKPPPPPQDIPPPTQNFTGLQGYRNPPPDGIGMLRTALVPGADGVGITVVDIERNWILDHEDLGLDPTANIDSATPFVDFVDHGTAVLGILAAKNNEYGVTGIASAATLLVAPDATEEFGFSPGRAISLATGVLKRGDIILLEVQGRVCNQGLFGFGPAEGLQPTFDATATATAMGIIVVAGAGNGGLDLDDPTCGNMFDRTVRDSGAIIVGGGSSSTHSRLFFSSYGSRVDVQGWGELVATLGYGDLFDPRDERQRYTNFFNGTSSASAIIAGVVLSIQGASMASQGVPLTPKAIRQLLVDTGTPQYSADPPGEKIGPLPSIPDAWARLQMTSRPLKGDLDGDEDVDEDDINIVLEDRNMSIDDSRCGTACDINKDGIIDALDARKWTLLCTRLRCASK